MIDKNSSGTSLSNQYNTFIQSPSRQFAAKVYIDDVEKTTYTVVDATVTKGSCFGTEFCIGSLISNTLEITLKGVNRSTNLQGKKIQLRIGLYINSYYEWVTLGTGYITQIKWLSGMARITALGSIATKLKNVCGPAVTWTLSRIIYEIQAQTGLTIGFGDISDYLNYEVAKSVEGLTTYQALQVLASVVCGFATEDEKGNISIKRFTTGDNDFINRGMMLNEPDLEKDDFEITGLQVITQSGYEDTPPTGYTSGNVNFVLHNPYITSTIFNKLVNDFIGYTYRPGTIGLSLGDPRIEAGDFLFLEDTSPYPYIACHEVRHTYDGGLSTEVRAIRPTNSEEGIGASTEVQAVLQTLQSGVSTAYREAREAKTIAGNTNQYFWFVETGTDTGAHITGIPQEDFLDDPQNAGGNVLARSNGIAIRDGLTELSSWDASGIYIGLRDGHHVYQALDYRSMRMLDKGDVEYFRVADLRDQNGTYTFTERFTGSGIVRTFYLSVNADAAGTVTVDGATTTVQWTINASGTDYITFTTSPVDGAEILVTYPTSDNDCKLFTFGSRPNNSVLGALSFAEGKDNTASGFCSHAEGQITKARMLCSHSEGFYTDAEGMAAHAEGSGTTASGEASHAEGYETIASRAGSHAEGLETQASGYNSHAEGNGTIASGSCSHAEGYFTEASGLYSHASGEHTIADEYCQTVVGKCNASSTARFVIGNGLGENDRRNALEAYSNGDLDIAGSLSQSSDRRLKDHLSYLGQDAVNFIKKLKPALFRKNGSKHLGFYAQDVEDADEWNCLTGEMNGFKTLNYIDLIAPLVAYCQQLEQRIEELENK